MEKGGGEEMESVSKAQTACAKALGQVDCWAGVLGAFLGSFVFCKERVGSSPSWSSPDSCQGI